MTLQDLAWSLGQVAVHHNAVNGFYGCSSIGQLNTEQLTYPALALVPSGDIIQRNGFSEYNMTFYVVDRLLTDNANDFDIYSFSVETLKNFFKQLKALPGMIKVTDEPVIRLFHNERNNDRVCGAYATVALSLEDIVTCTDWGEVPDINTFKDPEKTIYKNPPKGQIYYKTKQGIAIPEEIVNAGGIIQDETGRELTLLSSTYGEWGVLEYDGNVVSGSPFAPVYVNDHYKAVSGSDLNVTEVVFPMGYKCLNTFFGLTAGWCPDLKSITLPNGTEAIGANDFYEYGNPTMIIVPLSVKRIGNGTFRLTNNICYNGTMEQFRAIEKSTDASGYINWIIFQTDWQKAYVHCADGDIEYTRRSIGPH